ncbi:hypothetical protein TNCV_4138491 [Trichonephila clavipes]|nr:hypothetical protein TNCV_4138491 [Trichonephila clavipes]
MHMDSTLKGTNIVAVDVSMMCRLIKKEALDCSEAVEHNFRKPLNSFIREDQIVWVFWAELERPDLNCWETEDMLWGLLDITVIWAMIYVTS